MNLTKKTKSQVTAMQKRLEEGEKITLWLCPSNCYPNNSPMNFAAKFELGKEGVWSEEYKEYTPLEKIINSFSYYNCNNELGKRVHYYIEPKKFFVIFSEKINDAVINSLYEDYMQYSADGTIEWHEENRGKFNSLVSWIIEADIKEEASKIAWAKARKDYAWTISNTEVQFEFREINDTHGQPIDNE